MATSFSQPKSRPSGRLTGSSPRRTSATFRVTFQRHSGGTSATHDRSQRVFAAFQFDPEAAKDIDETRWPGVTLLKAQMNADLLTEDLKKKRASNESFWLVGQPDVETVTLDDGLLGDAVHAGGAERGEALFSWIVSDFGAERRHRIGTRQDTAGRGPGRRAG